MTDAEAGRARDFLGYGRQPPDPRWPNGAHVAVNFVINYEEGGEYSVPDGDPASEAGLTEGATAAVVGRDLAAESMFMYEPGRILAPASDVHEAKRSLHRVWRRPCAGTQP